MPLDKVGLDIEALNNINPPNISLPSTSEGFLNEIPLKANELTGGYLGITILTSLFFFLVWKLHDLTEYGYEKFSQLRTLGIASGICGVLGLLCLQIGYFTNYYHVVIFLGFSMIALIWTKLEEN